MTKWLTIGMMSQCVRIMFMVAGLLCIASMIWAFLTILHNSQATEEGQVEFGNSIIMG